MLSEYGLRQSLIQYSSGHRGNPYGVIGIDLTLDYLRKMLYYDEIADNKQGAYLLAISHERMTWF